MGVGGRRREGPGARPACRRARARARLPSGSVRCASCAEARSTTCTTASGSSGRRSRNSVRTAWRARSSGRRARPPRPADVRTAGRRAGRPGCRCRSRRWRPALEEFGSHVERSAGQVRGRLACLRRPRAAEVHEDDAPAHFAHHVVGLDVAMKQRRALQRRQRAAQIDAMPMTSRALIGPRSRTISASVSPWMNSIQMPTCSESCSAP